MELDERYFSKIDRRGTDECWEWLAADNGAGYGYFGIGGKTYLAHRLAYEHWVGPIPEGEIILHLCSNRACCNPSHLRPGTHSENHLQAYQEGREPAGCYTRRLTDEDVEAIRRDTRIQRVIAQEWGVTQQYVSKLKRRQRR